MSTEQLNEIDELKDALIGRDIDVGRLTKQRDDCGQQLAAALAACKVKHAALEILWIGTNPVEWDGVAIKSFEDALDIQPDDMKDVILCDAKPAGFRAFNEAQSCWEYGREPEDTQGTYTLELEPLYRAWEPK